MAQQQTKASAYCRSWQSRTCCHLGSRHHVQLLLFGLDIDDPPKGFEFWREEDASVLPKPTQEQIIATAERAAVQDEAAEAAARRQYSTE